MSEKGEKRKKHTAFTASKKPSRKKIGDITFKSEEQKVRFLNLSSREVVVTRFIDNPSLHKIGLYEGIRSCLISIGWGALMEVNRNTYKTLTLEFLSSLKMKGGSLNRQDEEAINFRILNRNYEMSLDQMNEIFGFPVDGLDEIPYLFHFSEAWDELVKDRNEPYKASMSKASKLKNPCLRYIHKFLTYSILGRGESGGVVGRNELFLLWCVENKKEVSGAMIMIKHMLSVAKGEKGKIVVGGLITHIAISIGAIDLSSIEILPILGNNRVDMDVMRAMGMVEKRDGGFVLVEGIDEHHEDEAGPSARVEEEEEGEQEEQREPTRPRQTDSQLIRAMYDRMTDMQISMIGMQSDIREIKESLHRLTLHINPPQPPQPPEQEE